MAIHTLRSIPLCLGALLTPHAGAQDEASTLASLIARADAVAVARAVGVDAPQSGTLRVALRVDDLLAGDLAGTLFLSEPAERGCGRALHAVVPGQRFLLCVRRQDSGHALCAGGVRALPLATEGVVAHVRGLLAAAAGVGRATVLITGLTDTDRRVRDDAALALPLDVSVREANPEQRAAIVQALRTAIATDERSAPSLMTACAYLHLEPAIDVLLPRYLDGSAGASERLFADSMLRIGQDALASRVSTLLPGLDTPLARARATHLLLGMDVDAARAPLLHLARSAGERGTRARACAGLLRLGCDESELATAVDAELLAMARELARQERPRFRSILPK